MGVTRKDREVKILVVEDDPFLLKILDVKLNQEGFNVIKATDGEKGISLAFREMPDLILLDLILPKKDGFRVLEELKENSKTRDIPVLILSNLGQESDIERGTKLGAVDYLIKTRFSINAVIEKIKRYLPTKNGKKIAERKKREFELLKKRELVFLKKQMKEISEKIKKLEKELK